jgi:drug/metabolite transporter (DMT)-like permease
MTLDPDNRNLKLGLSAVIAASVLFSAKSVFFKLCYRYGTPPVVLQALRSIFSTPFYFWPFLIHHFRPGAMRPAPLSRRDLAIIVWLGFSGYYLASIFDMVGLQYVSAGTERLILYIYPTLVVIFTALIFRKRIPRSLFLPLGLSYAGIALSFGGEAAGVPGGRPFYGGFLIFLSAVFYALFLVWQGRMVGRIGPQRLAAGCMIVATVFVLAQFLLCYPLDALAQPAPVLVIAFFTAIFCNVLPVYLYGYGVNLVGAGKAAVVSSVGPVSTLILGGGLLGESVGILQLAGLALVVGGTLKLGMGKPPQATADQPANGSLPTGPVASPGSPVSSVALSAGLSAGPFASPSAAPSAAPAKVSAAIPLAVATAAPVAAGPAAAAMVPGPADPGAGSTAFPDSRPEA